MSGNAAPANLVLIGLMGAGKSTTGLRLAKRLGRPFIDTDAQVEVDTGKTIAEIFAQDGEDGFRRAEAETVSRICQQRGQVIAVGGGTVLNKANTAVLRKNGTIFWLDVEPDILVGRMGSRVSRAHRPLLADATSADELHRRVNDLRDARDEAYRSAAHHIIRVDGGQSGEAVITEILRIIGHRPPKHP
ncbi:shikimate kinase [Stomatohabitans albus]|uniref:shikimate kinase n=1 Tax=Stomatohabitans albus TaxID=3110766 RepID=UPI00300CB8B8